MFISHCIRKFLEQNTYIDLAGLYRKNMEVQIMVDRGDGIKTENNTFTDIDGIDKWYNIRIPKNANIEPEDNDRAMPYDLIKHALGIGMTGWNWQEKQSIWVGFDFDSLIGHSDKHGAKLTENELTEIITKVQEIPYVTVRKSTSGNGLHLYIFVNNIPTQNHTEHAALARYILGILSVEANYNFESKVDACGGVLWQWHKKMVGTSGLKLIKQGTILENIPDDWKLHIPIILGKKHKVIPWQIPENQEEEFLELTGQRHRISFDKEHKRLLNWLYENGHNCSYNQDLHLITAHTYSLKLAHEALNLKGKFETIAEGTEQGDRNCFCYPLHNGGWTIKRFNRGVQEHEYWSEDKSGYTSIFYNCEPDLATSVRVCGGIEMTTRGGGYSFKSVKYIIKLIEMLNLKVEIPEWFTYRSAILKKHHDGRLILKIDVDPDEDAKYGEPKGFNKEGKHWCRFIEARIETHTNYEVSRYADMIRHLLTPDGKDAGWVIKGNNNIWQTEPVNHVTKFLKALGCKGADAEIILGRGINKSWTLVCKPFQAEYPGDKQWNRNAPQLRFSRVNSDNLAYPTWQKLLNHLGKSLDPSIAEDQFCKENNIYTGSDYLRYWISSLIQYPGDPLPYLFFFGPEESGKSTLHEAISLLFTCGVRRADTAILSKNDFTAELENSILCVVEDKSNLAQNKNAMFRLRDWVTSPKIIIHKKGVDPYEVPNQTHWVQVSNDRDACPVFKGDTRITVIFIEPLTEMIPKNKLMQALEKEAPDFLTEILSIEIPEIVHRLRLPVIKTNEKVRLQEFNMNELELFLKERCCYLEGNVIKFSEFYDKFTEQLDPMSVYDWSKIKVSREIPPEYPVGKSTADVNQRYIGNICWIENFEKLETKRKLVLREGKLVQLIE